MTIAEIGLKERYVQEITKFIIGMRRKIRRKKERQSLRPMTVTFS